MKIHKPNRQRAARAKLGLADYINDDPHAPADQHVLDMLCDLRHYCDVMRLDFADCDRRALDHYRVERQYSEPMGYGAPAPLASPRRKREG